LGAGDAPGAGRAGAILLAQGEKPGWRKKKDNGGAPKKPAVRAGQAGVVKKLLKNAEKTLSGKAVKATLGDYIKLVQLQKELDDEEQPREIKVTWVEPGETKSGNEE
jgi:hypothetical protein